MSITVNLQAAETIIKHPKQKQFQQWLDETFTVAKPIIDKMIHEVNIKIVDKKEMSNLNQIFRHKNGPTNVLSFTEESLAGIAPESLGDIAICAEIVEEEALSQNKPLEAHWAHLTIHGILHLLGYDHVKDNDAKAMEGIEIKIMNQLGYNNPYLED